MNLERLKERFCRFGNLHLKRLRSLKSRVCVGIQLIMISLQHPMDHVMITFISIVYHFKALIGINKFFSSLFKDSFLYRLLLRTRREIRGCDLYVFSQEPFVSGICMLFSVWCDVG